MRRDRKTYLREWRAANRDRLREHDRAYRATRRERERELARARYGTVTKNRNLKKYYGITLEQYNAMSEAQQGLCAICGQAAPGKHPLVVDHDHETGKVRALLCTHCNRGLGGFRDNASFLEKAASYVQEHKNGNRPN